MFRIILLAIVFTFSACFGQKFESSKYPAPDHIMGVSKQSILDNLICAQSNYTLKALAFKIHPNHLSNGKVKKEYVKNYKDTVKVRIKYLSSSYQFHGYFYNKSSNTHFFSVFRHAFLNIIINSHLGKFTLDDKNEIDSLTILYSGDVMFYEAYHVNSLFEKMILGQDTRSLLTGKNKKFYEDSTYYGSCQPLSYFNDDTLTIEKK